MTEINHLATVEAMNVTEMMILWNIDSLINTVSTNRASRQGLETAISEAMESASRHEILLQSQGHSSQFIRSSLHSRDISHNAYMEQAIGSVVGIRLNLFLKDY